MSVINVIKLLDFFLIMHARTLKMLNKKIPVVNISSYAFSDPIYTITDAVTLGKPSSLEPIFAPVLGVPVEMEQKL